MAVITILGAGVMGSAMVLPARDRGHEVRLVGTHLDQAIIDSVARTGRHPRLNVKLPDGVKAFAHGDFGEAFGGDTDLVILGVSSAGVGWAIERLCETLKKPVRVMMITKGLMPKDGTILTLPDFVQAEVQRRTGMVLDLAAVGGPCIAGELAVRRQTGVVFTSRTAGLAAKLCGWLETDYYHPRVSDDLAGVELCAAFKNFFAISVGWAAGQHEKMPPVENGAFNFNAASVIFDQAIAEMMVLARFMGGSEKSVWGMPGAGDLYVTCQAGRNSRLGRQLGLGLSYAEVKAGPMKDDTIEGAELGIALASTLKELMAAGRLDAAQLPVTAALLQALTANDKLAMPWSKLHRYA
ncbi:glycerol-3-phosphate dehydrogenase [Nordella sp. HKS 07]|uniref:glycerol-3-phosphate dehydrogenase n=1 Tax=Nordella sp. HKS 07 TaxID=2712222 RepID=UPI0013E13BC6|nr:glycerol-3-phosphate dehydrogenase [Nordella sp. HKS 07]QIG47908.1 glycerol-3-phosphate dehydrogenase [Nordella sp. HKS 07]